MMVNLSPTKNRMKIEREKEESNEITVLSVHFSFESILVRLTSLQKF
jgi:hypothetical protein